MKQLLIHFIPKGQWFANFHFCKTMVPTKNGINFSQTIFRRDYPDGKWFSFFRKPFFAGYILLTGFSLQAQIQVSGSVLSAAGYSGQNGAIAVSGTLGEAFIFSRTEAIYWGQGFQTNHALTVTSIVETGEQAFQIRMFPNPTSDFFFVESDKPVRSLCLYAPTGQLVLLIREFPDRGIDISALPPGIYAIHADTGNGLFPAGRIVKIRI